MNRWIAGRVLWPMTERLLGRDTMRRCSNLQASDRWAAEKLRELQNQKLCRLLDIARTHCPFQTERFRRAGFDVHDPKLTVDDLCLIPTVSRADITEHLEAMTWHDAPHGGPLPYATGGSSGEPLKLYVDRCRHAADWAARWRARGWFGVHPGDHEVLLWGTPQKSTSTDGLRRRRDALLNQHLLSAFDMTSDTMDQYLHRIRLLQPACLYGYASSLALLARHALDHKIEINSGSLRAIFVTGEVLFESDRQDILRAFGAAVVNEYGSRDGGLLACQCPAGWLHVPQENVIVEILDDDNRPVAPGEIGEVVVTYLELFAMPLIRYRIGDLARSAAESESICSCGRASQRLAEVRGRVTDQIVVRDGSRTRRMHALSLMYVLREADGLRQFRITQPTLDRLDVDLVVDDRFTHATEQRVEQGLRQRLGQEVAVKLHRRDRIPPLASGKHACVLSEISGSH